jgi:MtN3 and saliva related transmembrane protein
MTEERIIEIIGYLALFCTSISLIPQVIELYRTRSVKGISTYMYVIYALGMLLWLIYTLYIEALPLIIGNIVSLILAIIILTMKYIWRSKK